MKYYLQFYGIDAIDALTVRELSRNVFVSSSFAQFKHCILLTDYKQKTSNNIENDNNNNNKKRSNFHEFGFAATILRRLTQCVLN